MKKALLLCFFLLLVMGIVIPHVGSFKSFPRQDKQSLHSLSSDWCYPQISPVISNFYSITGIDNNLWIAGSEGVVLTSTDEGMSWNTVNSDFTGIWYSIAFVNSSFGFLTGSAGTVARSNDGGTSWSYISTGTIADLYTQAWINSSHGWIAGSYGVLLSTQDSGSTWTPHSLPWSNDLRAMAFIDETHGWLAGTNGLMAYTTDSGVSWIAVSVSVVESWHVMSVEDENKVWLAGTSGTLLHTTDGGETWKKIPTKTSSTITTVVSFSSSTVLIAGENGFCSMLDSTGSTYTAKEPHSISTLWAGYFVTSSNGWLVGDNGLILRIAPAQISATIDIDPETLNLKSKGQWITGYIELPEDYNVEDIDVSTIALYDGDNFIIGAELQPTELGDYNNNGIYDLMVKFDRQALINYLKHQEYRNNDMVELKVAGEVTGTPFEGFDSIRILDKSKET